ncbi:phosphoenolpyruvate synthase/pyruvate phosphate dikinase [Moorella thermoacetica Y72]|uniref:Phosphoenolpyruvate synthase/pyruvate phosphate dikinase n=1 Tax=Moorella thermoacetica Y72 TaxID=1325331 RepID=A0A0S6U7Q6_NEOTH|nr:PEP-utilizing enzyme [Moorella thermoacetica]GAF25002.1 phosphoenolpyruvate synthase/pyruvate phosphate dikinase [Moorella thermoacetica Y72]
MSEVLGTYFGDDKFPVNWESEVEKQLHWFYDDLHCPNPISPMYFDIGGWWGDTCAYMYRRFGAPFGKGWIAKKINNYVYTAVLPREPEEAQKIAPYYSAVMPVYAEKFLDWWKERYLPEIIRNNEYLDNFPYDKATIPELLIHLEEALDIQERHFKIHWILNLAQFQAFLEFRAIYKEVLGAEDPDNIGKILVSDNDRNWDSIRELWKLKEKIKSNPDLRKLFDLKEPNKIMTALKEVDTGQEFLKDLAAYQKEYGYKAIYTHEYIYPTWIEDPTPIIEMLINYLDTDYDFNAAYNKCCQEREQAIKDMFDRVKDEQARAKLQKALDLALRMAPLTPDHHFYIDQGTYARMRLVLINIGKALVKAGILEQADDTIFLTYDELRQIAVTPQAFDVKTLVRNRRAEREAAFKIHPPDWVGTVTRWSLYEEPYKTLWGFPEKFEKAAAKAEEVVDVVKGLPASPGVVEGIARYVVSPAEFDQVQKGEILICKMTNPAWVVVFTKIAGLVTDAGGVLAHPAVVSREFGIPAVVGTSNATQKIKTGDRIRVNGNTGVVEIIR